MDTENMDGPCNKCEYMNFSPFSCPCRDCGFDHHNFKERQPGDDIFHGNPYEGIPWMTLMQMTADELIAAASHSEDNKPERKGKIFMTEPNVSRVLADLRHFQKCQIGEDDLKVMKADCVTFANGANRLDEVLLKAIGMIDSYATAMQKLDKAAQTIAFLQNKLKETEEYYKKHSLDYMMTDPDAGHD